MLGACSSGSVPGEDGGDSSGGGSSDCGACPCVGDLTVEKPQSIGNTGICSISGTLTESATLPALATDEWHIVGSITVESGILTVRPGVEIFAEQGEYIYVMPGASLRAIGTASEPIIFSSVDDGLDLATGATSDDGWVGILLEDDSQQTVSRLEYVVIAEAGQPSTIINTTVTASLTLLGEHEDTILRNVQVHDSAADGIALTGSSTVNRARMENVLVTGSGRDGFNLDQFSGLIKEFMVIHRPGTFTSLGSPGGRSGLVLRGSNSDPLILNGTLIGADTSTELGNSNQLEVGLLFDDNVVQTRIANIALADFRNGCYAVGNGVDLSTAAIGSPPDDNFIDGTHCINEVGTASNSLVVFGGVGLPAALSGSGGGDQDGLRFYEGAVAEAAFQGEADTTLEFTAAWYLESVTDAAANTWSNGVGGNLKRYNDGVDPFTGKTGDELYTGIVLLGGVSFFCGSVPADLPTTDTLFVDGSTEEPLASQPSSGFVCGFIKDFQASANLFDLSSVGAVLGPSTDIFDDWPIHQCGATVTDPDFCP